MAIGGYRFRRSFGNVASRFRGARFDTYPLTPYPTEGLVLDLAAFTYTDSGVQDKSGEDNEAVLYSGRGVNLAGADYVELPDVGATKSITVLVRSSTDTFIYATDDATQTEDAINIITADGTWKEVILTFPNAVSGKIRLGAIGAGPSFFSGDLANARCYDASSALLDQFYLNEHTDVAAGGLDGLPCVGRNGNIGQYVDCAAVTQIAGDVGGLTPPQVLGMDFNQYRWFNGVDTAVLSNNSGLGCHRKKSSFSNAWNYLQTNGRCPTIVPTLGHGSSGGARPRNGTLLPPRMNTNSWTLLSLAVYVWSLC